MYFVIGKDDCPYCQKTKDLLDRDNTFYVYKNLSQLPLVKKEAWKDFIQNELSRTTVPIVINLVGGYSELKEELDGTRTP